MGMFDNITVSQKFKLPIDREQQQLIDKHVGKTKVWRRRFQTKSLENLLDYYDIDEHGVLGSKYTLEVSSPGLYRPLKFKRQFVKNKGRVLKVNLEEGGKVEGRIMEVDEVKIVLEIKNISRSINFESIKSAQLVPSFK